MVRVVIVRAHQVVMDPRVRAIAKTLSDAGYDVNILYWNTSAEKHPDLLEGAKLVEIQKDRIMRLLKYESFQLGLWWRKGAKALSGLLDNLTIMHCFDFSALPLCTKVKKKEPKKTILIYDAADVWEYMVSGEIPSLLLNYQLRLEQKCMKHVDFLITPGERYQEYYTNRGFPESRAGIVMNAKEMYVDQYVAPNNAKPVIVYVGTLKHNRKILELMNAIKDFPELHLRIGGIGPLFEEVKRKAEQLDNVEFLGQVPYSQVMELTFKSDAIYAMFDNTHPLTKIGFPNKFFEAAATGRPIITSTGTYLGEIVKRLGMGIVVEPNESGIRKALTMIRDSPEQLVSMGKSAFENGKREYNWQHESEKLLQLYNALIEQHSD